MLQAEESTGINRFKIYEPIEAIEDIKENQPSHKTDEAVNVYLRLNVDTTK